MTRRRPLPTARFLAAALLAVATLTGCLGRDDALAPLVAIREPKSGTTRTTEDLRIVGYVMDDEGVAALEVDGTDLLAFDVYAGERGKRFVEFVFTIPDLGEGETTTRIVARDVSGRTSTLLHTLRIDVTPPTLEIVGREALEGGGTRIEGVARDDVAVSAIRAGDVPLAFAPAAEHRFAVDVPEGGTTLVVEDGAGNVTARSVE